MMDDGAAARNTRLHAWLRTLKAAPPGAHRVGSDASARRSVNGYDASPPPLPQHAPMHAADHWTVRSGGSVPDAPALTHRVHAAYAAGGGASPLSAPVFMSPPAPHMSPRSYMSTSSMDASRRVQWADTSGSTLTHVKFVSPLPQSAYVPSPSPAGSHNGAGTTPSPTPSPSPLIARSPSDYQALIDVSGHLAFGFETLEAGHARMLPVGVASPDAVSTQQQQQQQLQQQYAQGAGADRIAARDQASAVPVYSGSPDVVGTPWNAVWAEGSDSSLRPPEATQRTLASPRGMAAHDFLSQNAHVLDEGAGILNAPVHPRAPDRQAAGEWPPASVMPPAAGAATSEHSRPAPLFGRSVGASGISTPLEGGAVGASTRGMFSQRVHAATAGAPVGTQPPQPHSSRQPSLRAAAASSSAWPSAVPAGGAMSPPALTPAHVPSPPVVPRSAGDASWAAAAAPQPQDWSNLRARPHTTLDAPAYGPPHLGQRAPAAQRMPPPRSSDTPPVPLAARATAAATTSLHRPPVNSARAPPRMPANNQVSAAAAAARRVRAASPAPAPASAPSSRRSSLSMERAAPQPAPALARIAAPIATNVPRHIGSYAAQQQQQQAAAIQSKQEARARGRGRSRSRSRSPSRGADRRGRSASASSSMNTSFASTSSVATPLAQAGPGTTARLAYRMPNRHVQGVGNSAASSGGSSGSGVAPGTALHPPLPSAAAVLVLAAGLRRGGGSAAHTLSMPPTAAASAAIGAASGGGTVSGAAEGARSDARFFRPGSSIAEMAEQQIARGVQTDGWQAKEGSDSAAPSEVSRRSSVASTLQPAAGAGTRMDARAGIHSVPLASFPDSAAASLQRIARASTPLLVRSAVPAEGEARLDGGNAGALVSSFALAFQEGTSSLRRGEEAAFDTNLDANASLRLASSLNLTSFIPIAARAAAGMSSGADAQRTTRGTTMPTEHMQLAQEIMTPVLQVSNTRRPFYVPVRPLGGSASAAQQQQQQRADNRQDATPASAVHGQAWVPAFPVPRQDAGNAESWEDVSGEHRSRSPLVATPPRPTAAPAAMMRNTPSHDGSDAPLTADDVCADPAHARGSSAQAPGTPRHILRGMLRARPLIAGVLESLAPSMDNGPHTRTAPGARTESDESDEPGAGVGIAQQAAAKRAAIAALCPAVMAVRPVVPALSAPTQPLPARSPPALPTLQPTREHAPAAGAAEEWQQHGDLRSAGDDTFTRSERQLEEAMHKAAAAAAMAAASQATPRQRVGDTGEVTWRASVPAQQPPARVPPAPLVGATDLLQFSDDILADARQFLNPASSAMALLERMQSGGMRRVSVASSHASSSADSNLDVSALLAADQITAFSMASQSTLRQLESQKAPSEQTQGRDVRSRMVPAGASVQYVTLEATTAHAGSGDGSSGYGTNVLVSDSLAPSPVVNSATSSRSSSHSRFDAALLRQGTHPTWSDLPATEVESPELSSPSSDGDADNGAPSAGAFHAPAPKAVATSPPSVPLSGAHAFSEVDSVARTDSRPSAAVRDAASLPQRTRTMAPPVSRHTTTKPATPLFVTANSGAARRGTSLSRASAGVVHAPPRDADRVPPSPGRVGKPAKPGPHSAGSTKTTHPSLSRPVPPRAERHIDVPSKDRSGSATRPAFVVRKSAPPTPVAGVGAPPDAHTQSRSRSTTPRSRTNSAADSASSSAAGTPSAALLKPTFSWSAKANPSADSSRGSSLNVSASSTPSDTVPPSAALLKPTFSWSAKAGGSAVPSASPRATSVEKRHSADASGAGGSSADAPPSAALLKATFSWSAKSSAPAQPSASANERRGGSVHTATSVAALSTPPPSAALLKSTFSWSAKSNATPPLPATALHGRAASPHASKPLHEGSASGSKPLVGAARQHRDSQAHPSPYAASASRVAQRRMASGGVGSVGNASPATGGAAGEGGSGSAAGKPGVMLSPTTRFVRQLLDSFQHL